jgi:hypothetical protein
VRALHVAPAFTLGDALASTLRRLKDFADARSSGRISVVG